MDNETRDWLRAAKRDYDTYAREVRLPILFFIKRTPKEPQNAAYHLSQCVEKLVKSIAITSGYCTAEEVIRYSHNSLSFYADLTTRVLSHPICELFFSSVQGKLFAQSDAQLYGYAQSIQKLAELKAKSKLGPITREMNAWAWEFATLSESAINRMVNQQKKSIRLAKLGATVIHLLPMRFLKRSKTNSDAMYSGILLSLNRHGFLLSDAIRGFLSHEKIRAFIAKADDKKKIEMLSKTGDILVIACLFTSLLCLAAITYPHSAPTRYPDTTKSPDKRKLDSESYTETFGFTRALTNVGTLTNLVLRETRRRIDSFGGTKTIIDNICGEIGLPPGGSC